MSDARVIVFDIETSNQFSDVGSYDPAALDISIVGTYDSGTGAYTAYTQDELSELWKVLEQAHILVGFNSDHFDIPLLNKYYPGDLSRIRSVDLLKEIYNSLGRRIRLDVVAEGTLNTKKSGNGLEALQWWRQGDVEKVKAYCLKDVEITKGIFDYALANGKVRYHELGKTREVVLDTSSWFTPRDSALTHTLGF